MSHNFIFIIDRDIIKGNFLKYRLAASGFRNVSLFQSHDECIYSIQKNQIPDFILAHTCIKGMTDLEFVYNIKTNFPGIKVIFFSESDDVTHITELYNAGATDYILQRGENQNWINELISNIRFIVKEEFLLK